MQLIDLKWSEVDDNFEDPERKQITMYFTK